MNCLAQSSPVDSTKDWNVSAALRGFYDSNIATDVNQNQHGSYGVELSPHPFRQPAVHPDAIGRLLFLRFEVVRGDRGYFAKVSRR